jgi:hypothetical protein
MNTKSFAAILFSTIFLLDCSNKPIGRSVTIEQIQIEADVKFYADTANNYVFGCDIPLLFTAKSTSLRTGYFGYFNYYFNKNYGKAYLSNLSKYSGGWFGLFLVFQYIDNKFVEGSPDARLLTDSRIRLGHSLKFIIMPHYDLDSSQSMQAILKNYLEKMKNQHTNTLSLPFSEFKKNHSDLVETLLKGDSIRFGVFATGDYNTPYDPKKDTFITMPVKY